MLERRDLPSFQVGTNCDVQAYVYDPSSHITFDSHEIFSAGTISASGQDSGGTGTATASLDIQTTGSVLTAQASADSEVTASGKGEAIGAIANLSSRFTFSVTEDVLCQVQSTDIDTINGIPNSGGSFDVQYHDQTGVLAFLPISNSVSTILVPKNTYMVNFGGQTEAYSGGLPLIHSETIQSKLTMTIVGLPTTIAPTSLQWDTTNGGIDFGYQVGPNPVPLDTDVALYWSAGPGLLQVIGGPVYTQPISAGTATGNYGPFNVPLSMLGTPPQGANYLLVVTDPNNAIGTLSTTSILALPYTPPTQLVIPADAQPPDITGLNTPFQVRVLAEDANGNLDQFYDGNVTIQLSNNPTNATLTGPSSASGSVTVQAVNGEATFSGLSLNKVGNHYKLQATSNSLSSTTTNELVVALTPAQIRMAYGFDRIPFLMSATDPNYYNDNAGAGQTIAIVVVGDNHFLADSTDPSFASSDLVAYDKMFNLPDPPSFRKTGVATDGTLSDTALPQAPQDPRWAIEEDMDVEWVHALAPKANILVVETKDDLLSGVPAAATDPSVSVVSISGGTVADNSMNYAAIKDKIESGFDSRISTPAGHQGVTFVASSGDNINYNSSPPIAYPAISPNVVSVGGTVLALNADGTYSKESGWGASGGGVAINLEVEPAYQGGVQNTDSRTFPDVAFDADGTSAVAVFFSTEAQTDNPWTIYGGTSLGAPGWAALIALADQKRVANKGTTLDGRSQTLPALYGLPSADFHDAFVNDYLSKVSGYEANNTSTQGLVNQLVYNEDTGLGTPRADLVTLALANWKSVAITPTSLQISNVGVAYNQTIMASGGNGGPYSYSIVSGSLPPGIILNDSTGVISGTASATGSFNFTVLAEGALNAIGSQFFTLLVAAAAQSTQVINGNVTSSVHVTLAPAFSTKKKRGLFVESLWVLNTDKEGIEGPIYVVLNGLRNSVKVHGVSGFIGSKKRRRPYIVLSPVGGSLPSEKSVGTLLQFNARPNSFAISVFAGALYM